MERLTRDFQEALDKSMEPVIQKLACGMCPSEDGGEEQQTVNEACSVMVAFLDRICRDWMLSIDEQSRQQVKELFAELENVSTSDFAIAMRDGNHYSPFAMLATFFQGAEQQPVEEEVVIEVVDDECDQLS